MRRDVIGQFVTPQKTATMPHAAQSAGGRPNIDDKKLPRVAPIKSDGTISPPLKPPDSVNAVNIILRRNTYHASLPVKLRAMTPPPAPM